jgi:signal transduction histidine kinase
LASTVRTVASDVHRLAYQLHPAKLDQLGLVTAARSWCREFSKQSGLSIDFIADGIPSDLPDDVALGLYRVLQESLQNVARHSGSPSAEVRLSRNGSGLRLAISDAGKGFNTAGAPGGLGLVSMAERARLLNGTLVVHSIETVGTTVELAVPLVEDASRQVGS